MFLTDLIFIEDGTPNFLTGTQLINFSKRRRIAHVIREIQQYQLSECPLFLFFLLCWFLSSKAVIVFLYISRLQLPTVWNQCPSFRSTC